MTMCQRAYQQTDTDPIAAVADPGRTAVDGVNRPRRGRLGLTGSFTRAHARAVDWVEHGDLQGAVDEVRESGDPEDIPGHDRTHGTAAEREQAFRRAYDPGSATAHWGEDGEARAGRPPLT